MALNKSELFETREIRMAELMKALSHPARIAIIKLLADCKTCICGDITDALPLAQATVSQHLKALKSVGLIKGEISGVKTCYCLNEKTIEELKNSIEWFMNITETQIPIQCCTNESK